MCTNVKYELFVENKHGWLLLSTDLFSTRWEPRTRSVQSDEPRCTVCERLRTLEPIVPRTNRKDVSSRITELDDESPRDSHRMIVVRRSWSLPFAAHFQRDLVNPQPSHSKPVAKRAFPDRNKVQRR